LESSDLLLLEELLPLLDSEETELLDCLLLELLDPELPDELEPLDDPEPLDCLLLDPTELDPLDCLLLEPKEPELLDDCELELSLREIEGLLSRVSLSLFLTGSGALTLPGLVVTVSLASLFSLVSVACGLLLTGLLVCTSLTGCWLSRFTLFISDAFLSLGVLTSCLLSLSGRVVITLYDCLSFSPVLAVLFASIGLVCASGLSTRALSGLFLTGSLIPSGCLWAKRSCPSLILSGRL